MSKNKKLDKLLEKELSEVKRIFARKRGGQPSWRTSSKSGLTELSRYLARGERRPSGRVIAGMREFVRQHDGREAAKKNETSQSGLGRATSAGKYTAVCAIGHEHAAGLKKSGTGLSQEPRIVRVTPGASGWILELGAGAERLAITQVATCDKTLAIAKSSRVPGTRCVHAAGQTPGRGYRLLLLHQVEHGACHRD